jgi:hypothetical protein
LKPSYLKELRGFAPIGMLECWNIGIMGSGIMKCWPPARRGSAYASERLMVPPPAGLMIKLKWLISFRKPIFHRSTIPLFHFRGKFGSPKKPLYSQ